jgi:hypothetical protein
MDTFTTGGNHVIPKKQKIHIPPLELIQLPDILVIPPSSKLYLLKDVFPLPILEQGTVEPLAVDNILIAPLIKGTDILLRGTIQIFAEVNLISPVF